MAYTDEQYKNAETFILANLDNPAYIAQVAADLGISLADITDVVQRVDPNATEAQVEQYFSDNLVDYDRPYEAGIYSFETKENRDAYLSSGDPNLKYYNAALAGQPIDTSSDTTATQPATTTKATTTATQPVTTTKADTTTAAPYNIKTLEDISKLSAQELKAVRDFISNLYNTGGIGINAAEAKQIQDRAAALGVDPSVLNDLVSTAYKGYGGDTYSTEDISKLIGGLGTTLEGLQQQKIDAAKGYVAPTISGKGVDVSGESGLRSMYGPYVQDILNRASGLLALRDDPNFQEREFGTTYGTSTFKDLEDLQKQRKSMMGMGDDKSSMYTPYKYSFANMPATAEAQGQQTTKPAAKGGLMSLIDSYADGGTVGQTVPSTFTPPTGGYQQATYTPGSMNYTAPGTYQAGTIGSTFDQNKAGAYTAPAPGKEIASTFTTPNLYSPGTIGTDFSGIKSIGYATPKDNAIASTFTTPTNIYSAGNIGSTFDETKAGIYKTPTGTDEIKSTFTTPTNLYSAGNIGSTYDPVTKSYTGPGTGISTETFDAAAMQRLMNPYTSGVIDPQVREAKRQAQLAQMANAAKFTQAGAFGGTSNILANAELQRNLATQLGTIYGTGQKEAYDAALRAFEAEQGRKLQASTATEAARQEAGRQGLSEAQTRAQLALQGQTAQEAARQAAGAQALSAAQTAGQLGLQAQTAQEAARQAAGQQALTAATTSAELAQRGQVAQEAAKQAAGQQALTAATTAAQLGLQGQTAQEAARQAAGQQALSAAQTAAELGLRGQTAQEAAKQAAGQQALTAAQTAGQLGLQAQTAQEAAKQAAGQQAISAAQIAAQLGLQGSQLSEQSRQFAANYGLQSAQTAAQYDQAARQLQQQAEEAQARGDQFAANLALQQLQEAQRAAEATRGFEYQQARDQYLDPFRELGYAQQLLSGLPIKAGDTGISPNLEALVASLGLNSMFKGG